MAAPQVFNVREDFTLPRYERRAPEVDTASVHSSAPSYVSEAPSYSTLPQTSVPSVPLPNPAPRQRYQSLLPSPRDTPTLQHFDMPAWPTLAAPTMHARQYNSVAQRRAARADRAATGAGLGMLMSSQVARQRILMDASQEFPPADRPDESAAERELRQRKAREEEMLRQESKSWDFFTGQTGDWHEREIQWQRFQTHYLHRGLIDGWRYKVGTGSFGDQRESLGRRFMKSRFATMSS